jgi:hypothetical protein
MVSPAAADSIAVTISSNSDALTVPASVTIAAGASSAQFAAAAAPVTSNQAAQLTAAAEAGTNCSKAAISTNLTVMGGSAPLFYLRGNATEVLGTTNGSLVVPNLGPAGLKSQVIVKGAGYLAFQNVKDSDGVTFRQAGTSSTASTFMNFAGTPVGSIFNMDHGEVSFYLKSSYSFAEREALPKANYRWVYDVFDNSARLFSFATSSYSNMLLFTYWTGAKSPSFYFVPPGQENTVLGKGVVTKVRITWDGTRNQLYLNDVLVQTDPYTRATANWTGQSSLSIGALDPHDNGGAYPLDDALAQFQVK